MTKTTLITLLGILLMTGTALADHPRNDQMARVKYLANDLQEAAYYVHETAERYTYRHDRRQRRALKDLHYLHKQAYDFYCAVETYYRDPYRTEEYFRHLKKAFYDAKSAMRYFHGHDHVRQGFYKTERLMDDLIYYYEGGKRYGYGKGHHDRGHYDHDDTRYRGRPRFKFEIRWP